MSIGFEISAMGMDALALRQEIIANNLANSNTAGFKADVPIFKSFPTIIKQKIGLIKGGLYLDGFSSRFTPAPIKKTDNKFDVALKGDGFFVVETPEGPKYTRNGNFTLGRDGQLVTQQGFAVMGEGGSINISGSDIYMDVEGKIIVDGSTVDILKVVDFEKPYQLKKVGNNLFEPRTPDITPRDKPQTTEIWQGFLESSGVNVVQEMVQMVETLRAFEANQKVLAFQDEILRKAVNEIGRT